MYVFIYDNEIDFRQLFKILSWFDFMKYCPLQQGVSQLKPILANWELPHHHYPVANLIKPLHS